MVFKNFKSDIMSFCTIGTTWRSCLTRKGRLSWLIGWKLSIQLRELIMIMMRMMIKLLKLMMMILRMRNTLSELSIRTLGIFLALIFCYADGIYVKNQNFCSFIRDEKLAFLPADLVIWDFFFQLFSTFIILYKHYNYL